MDPGFLLVENFARFAAAAGLLIAVPLFAWAGYLWMTSMGDPNRAAARNAVISVCIGVVVIGCSFILPRVVAEFVVAPAGGVTFEAERGVNCDGIFRDRLRANREASTPARMNRLIQGIQSRFADCEPFFWSPVVREDDAPDRECHGSDSLVSGVKLPSGLDRGGFRLSRRDTRNNVLVYFENPEGLPSDGAVCWLYVQAIDTWVEGWR